MRVGLVIYGRLDQASGGYLYDRKLVSYLKKRGHQVQIISLPWRSYWLRLGDNFSSRLFKRLRSLRLDVLLQDELNHPSLFILNARLKKQVSFPLISIVHLLRSTEQHPALLAPLYAWIERRYLNSVDAFIFNSADTKKIVNRILKSPKPNIVATPGGDRLRPAMSAVRIKARAHRAGPLQVIFLGNLIHRKGAHLLVRAASQLAPGSLHITFAGRQEMEPAYYAELLRLVDQLNLRSAVEFCGFLDGHKLAARLRASQVLALPSAYEGFGIAYLEGLGFGLPAIGTRAGAARELIQPGKNGFLIQPGNAAELATILKRLHEDRDLLARMSLSAFNSFKQHPIWDQSLSRIELFLSSYNQISPRPQPHRRKR